MSAQALELPDPGPRRPTVAHRHRGPAPHRPARRRGARPHRAVATSGTAHRGDHLVDARTGRPPAGVASVTVVAAALSWADIDATAAYAHGRDAARWLRTGPAAAAWWCGRTGPPPWSTGQGARQGVTGGP